MVATLPGGPQTSSNNFLGLNGFISSATAPPPKVLPCTPKMPCSRYTQNPETATTPAMTSTSQNRVRMREKIDLCLSRRGLATLPSPSPSTGVGNGSVLGSVVVMGAPILNQGRRAIN